MALDSDTAVAQAFALPEVLGLIISHIRQGESFSNTHAPLARVATNWTGPVTSELWNTQTPLKHLSRIIRPRRQYYANKVRALALDIQELDIHLSNLDVTFARLETVELAGMCVGTEGIIESPQTPAALFMRQLLGPRVKNVVIAAPQVSLNADALFAMSELAPRLESLWLTLGSHTLPPLRLAAVIQSMGCHLQKLNLQSFAGNRSSEFVEDRLGAGSRLLQALTKTERLTHLRLCQKLSAKQCLQLFSPYNTDSFPHLTSFTGVVSVDAIPLLPRTLPQSLNELTLGVHPRCKKEPPCPLLPNANQACRALGLEKLTLNCSSARLNLRQAFWDALGKFTGLITLDVKTTGESEYRRQDLVVPAFDLYDYLFASMCRNWAQLTHLRLDVCHSLTAKALVALGSDCRQLVKFQIPGTFDIIDIFDRPATPPLWPQLRVFLTSRLTFNEERARTGKMNPSTLDLHAWKASIMRPHLPLKPRFRLIGDLYTATILNEVVYSDGPIDEETANFIISVQEMRSMRSDQDDSESE